MSPRTALPSVEEVTDLPQLLETVVTDEHEDANGHLNVTGYLALHDRAAWPWLAALGLDPSTSDGDRGVMDLEHHLRYVGEVHVGDVVAVHGQLIARDERRIHGLWYLVDHTRGQLANTLEFVSIHVDLRARRAAPFEQETAAALDQQIRDGRRPWTPPLSGTMSVR